MKDKIVLEEGTFTFKGIVTDGNIKKLKGYNVWDYEWECLNDSIIVKHPQYDQTHRFRLFRLVVEKEIYFIAGEYSNCVWGFYLKV